MWQEVKNAGGTEFVRLKNEERTVRVDRPLALVEALLSGEGETLNIAAALEQFGDLRGESVRVTEEKGQIRVWVDDQSVQ